MQDFAKLANAVIGLPEMKQREIICNALLEDLQTLKGRDLAPYLLDCTFDMVEPGTRFVLKFPMGTHIPNPFISQVKNDGLRRDNADL